MSLTTEEMRKMKRFRGIFITGFAALLLLPLVFYSCGSSKKDTAKAVTETVTDVASTTNKVGFTACFRCHADTSTGFNTVFGNSLIGTGEKGWLNSGHINVNNSPAYTDSKYATSCNTCHDPIGDGKLVETFYIDLAANPNWFVNAPIVSCESCHGAGSNHYGVGPIPYPEPDASRCGTCHDKDFPHTNVEADNIHDDYSASPHATSINEHAYDGDSTTDVRGKCSRCHTDEGARRYINLVNGTDAYSVIGTVMGDKPVVSNATAVQCRTCHEPHNVNRLLGRSVKDYATFTGYGWSDQFITCTSCHQLLTSSATPTLLDETYHAPVDSAGTTVNAYGAWDEVIADTHFDDTATTDVIEGYVIDPSATHFDGAKNNTNSGACLDCHNPHDADTTNHEQWAESAHGGEIATLKATAVTAASATDATDAVKAAVYTAGVTNGTGKGQAWVHYDFKDATRQACQRCHTSTGFRNFANDPANYDETANTFIASGGEKEMLYCWACHTDNVGTLRNPGTMTASALPYESNLDTVSTATPTPTRISLIGDIDGSNLCIACHSGRVSGQEIKDATDIAKNFGSFNSHYLAAGGSLYRTTGYEYATDSDGAALSYENASYYGHIKIGSSDADGTGSNGPCVGCHMSNNTEGHTFMPFIKDATTGAVTSIETTTCGVTGCHEAGGDYAMTAATLTTEEEEYTESLEALKAQLATKGIYHGSGYPYFFSVSDSASQSFGTAYAAWADKDTLGSAYNLNLLMHEPGGFAHNRYYVKRLIYDSIDWLDNGSMDGSVSATLDSATHSSADYQAGAKIYLISSSGGRP
jgi:hypothetical protein